MQGEWEENRSPGWLTVGMGVQLKESGEQACGSAGGAGFHCGALELDHQW